MNPSPLRSLVAKHICCCRTTSQYVPRLKLASIHAPQTWTAQRHASQYASSPPTYGSPELLKRRYQPKPVSPYDLERARTMKRIRFCVAGFFLCALGMAGTIYLAPDDASQGAKTTGAAGQMSSLSSGTSLDAPPSIASLSLDTSLSDEVEQVPTGTSTVPTFPKTIHLSSLDPPSSAAIVDAGEQEYQLVGLGIRTVSFLGIQVYVVGLYIAVPDIATLQERLIRILDPVATTLVPSEKGKLKDLLLDPEKGEDVWNSILKDGGIRTAFRIVPTRNTDFMHLRDGWVRGITAKTQHFAGARADNSFTDESFGKSLNDFKAMWGGGARKNVPKGETLLLTRDAQGTMTAWYEDKAGTSVKLGGLADERISRLIWLGYLGGKTVSSEGARQSVVEGLMDYVGRPVGTVATQVV